MNITNCPITNALISKVSRNSNEFCYDINLNGANYRICFCISCYDKIEFENYKHIIHGLILNDKLRNQTIHWEGSKPDEFDLKKFIFESDYPKTPEQKIENILLHIYQAQDYDGNLVSFENIFKNKLWFKFYLKESAELSFYLGTLRSKNLIEADKNSTQYRLTFEGLSNVIKLKEEGNNSKKCFVAMSFDDQHKEIFTSIHKSCKDTGFDAFKINDIHIESDVTINDAIIANIKKSKFCIADFTGQRNGVYFEAGYALGRNMKVIYTCSKDDFEKSHFDTNHFPHIIYNTPEELYKQLINKINAWIK